MLYLAEQLRMAIRLADECAAECMTDAHSSLKL